MAWAQSRGRAVPSPLFAARHRFPDRHQPPEPDEPLRPGRHPHRAHGTGHGRWQARPFFHRPAAALTRHRATSRLSAEDRSASILCPSRQSRRLPRCGSLPRETRDWSRLMASSGWSSTDRLRALALKRATCSNWPSATSPFTVVSARHGISVVGCTVLPFPSRSVGRKSKVIPRPLCTASDRRRAESPSLHQADFGPPALFDCGPQASG